MTSSSRIKSAVSLPATVITLSVIIHGLLLAVPMPKAEEQPDTSVATESEESLAVVVLPPQEQPAPSQEMPTVAAAEQGPQTVATRPATPPLDAEVPPPPPLSQTEVPPAPVEPVAPPSPPSEPLETVAEPSVEPTTLPPLESSPPTSDEPVQPRYGEPVTAAPPGPLVDYSDAFPHFEGAEGGCFGVTACRRVKGVTSYRSVARSLIADLEAQGYGVDLRDDLEDTGRNVYEVQPPDSGAVQYLLVFSDSDGSAIYVMSDEILTLRDLQTLQARTEAGRHSS